MLYSWSDQGRSPPGGAHSRPRSRCRGTVSFAPADELHSPRDGGGGQSFASNSGLTSCVSDWVAGRSCARAAVAPPPFRCRHSRCSPCRPCGPRHGRFQRHLRPKYSPFLTYVRQSRRARVGGEGVWVVRNHPSGSFLFPAADNHSHHPTSHPFRQVPHGRRGLHGPRSQPAPRCL